VPVWGRDGPDIAEKVRWAREHDEQVQRIGDAARHFAAEHLSLESRQCYWRALLRELHALLTFAPSLADYPRAVPLRRVPLRRALKRCVDEWTKGRRAAPQRPLSRAAGARWPTKTVRRRPTQSDIMFPWHDHTSVE
jgi:hypothetical protein